MTADPFTTPAEAEREAVVQQARDLLSRAENADHYPFAGAVGAIKNALVAQGLATLAVRDELADIASSLRTLAALPSEVRELTATLDQGVEFADSAAAAAGATASAMQDLAEFVDRPRWWQWRRRHRLGNSSALNETDA